MLHQPMIVMTLSGSVVMVLYGLFYPMAKRYFPPSWRKNVLHLALFFYLFPLPLLKEFLLSRLDIRFKNVTNGPVDMTYAVNLQRDAIFLSPGVILVLVLTFGMAIFTFIRVTAQLKEYHRIRRSYLRPSSCCASPWQLEKALGKIKEELLIRQRVKLVCSRSCETPLTIGVLSPTIILPPLTKQDLGPEDCEYILRHELLHIKSMDLLVNFLGLLARSLHWYNPICHFLYHELCVVSEMDCDYGVINGKDDSYRQRYSHLILDLATIGCGKKERFAVGLVNNDTATIERRILEMKQIRKKSRPVLSCIVAIAICVVGTITAFAYQEPQYYMLTDFSPENEIIFSIPDGTEAVEHFTYDHFFTDNNGHVTPINDHSAKIFCKHNYVTGQITNHAKNSSGGCAFTVSSAEQCSKCGAIKQGAIISEHKYTVCPH